MICGSGLMYDSNAEEAWWLILEIHVPTAVVEEWPVYWSGDRPQFSKAVAKWELNQALVIII